jgi:hypothetical protein
VYRDVEVKRNMEISNRTFGGVDLDMLSEDKKESLENLETVVKLPPTYPVNEPLRSAFLTTSKGDQSSENLMRQAAKTMRN